MASNCIFNGLVRINGRIPLIARLTALWSVTLRRSTKSIGRFDRPAGFARAARGSDVDPNLGGVFYEITPTGTLTTLYTFSQENGGAGGKPVIATPAICPALLMP